MPGSGISGGLTLKRDAWNRLVEVQEGQTVVGISNSHASTTIGG